MCHLYMHAFIDRRCHVYDIKYYRIETEHLITLIDLMAKLNPTLSYIFEKLRNKEI